MSQENATHQPFPEFDFWDFVSCSRCQLPLALETGMPTIPFWLTDCGHVLCNDHLNPDQTCPTCNAENIQLAPLQRQMEPPMSDWFSPVTSALDAVTFAVKFQQDTLASQVRHYKRRAGQYRTLVERMKNDIAEMKKANALLKEENKALRARLETSHSPGDVQNINGKRRMVAGDPRLQTSSSPLLPPTPSLNRLSSTPGQKAPGLFSRRHGLDTNQGTSYAEQPSRSLERYAYSPNSTPNGNQGQSLNRSLQGLSSNERPRTNNNQSPPILQHPLPPNPHSSRFKPASVHTISNSRREHISAPMLPPAIPQHARTPQVNAAGPATHCVPSHIRHMSSRNPDTPGNPPMNPSSSELRFFERTVSTPHPQSQPRVGQRMPFVPGTANGPRST